MWHRGSAIGIFLPRKELFDVAIDQYAQKQVDHICGILHEKMSLDELIRNMPTFLETENNDSYAQKVCHKKGNVKFHYQLSLKVCAKLQPVVKKLLLAAEEEGAVHIQDPETMASFCVYGQLGVLLNQEISPKKERNASAVFYLNL